MNEIDEREQKLHDIKVNIEYRLCKQDPILFQFLYSLEYIHHLSLKTPGGGEKQGDKEEKQVCYKQSMKNKSTSIGKKGGKKDQKRGK